MAPVFLTFSFVYATIYIMHLKNNPDNNTLNQLLEITVGNIFGPPSAEILEKIDEQKLHQARRIKKYLLLRKSDTVIDLGSGLGFVANHLADEVNHIHCVDIDKDFIELSKQTLRLRSNITYHLVEHGRLNTLPKVTAIYSNQVFCHFNLYDICQYLTECYRLLDIKGRMIFEISNDEHLDVTSDRWQRHLSSYNTGLNKSTTVYNNKNAVTRMIEQIGFHLITTFNDTDQIYFVLIKK